MRNLTAERRIIDTVFLIAGIAFIAGLAAIGIGTEIIILSLWNSDPAWFWIWQGVWIIVQAVIISAMARSVKQN
jgi:hypothetical protein